MTRDEIVRTLRARGNLARLVSFRCDFYALPPSAREALWGLAGELEQIADSLDTAEPLTAQAGVVGAEPDGDDGDAVTHV